MVVYLNPFSPFTFRLPLKGETHVTPREDPFGYKGVRRSRIRFSSCVIVLMGFRTTKGLDVLESGEVDIVVEGTNKNPQKSWELTRVPEKYDTDSILGDFGVFRPSREEGYGR